MLTLKRCQRCQQLVWKFVTFWVRRHTVVKS